MSNDCPDRLCLEVRLPARHARTVSSLEVGNVAMGSMYIYRQGMTIPYRKSLPLDFNAGLQP